MTDSSAALGVVRRRGNGKQHIRVGTLWIQEKRERGELGYDKVRGERNPGDLMTKGLSQRVVALHMEMLF